MELHQDPDMSIFARCMFPGSAVFRFILRLSTITTEAKEYINLLKYKHGWLTDYNINHNFSSPIRVEELAADTMRLISALHSLSKDAEHTMAEIYDKWTIGEFIEIHIKPILDDLLLIEKKTKDLMGIKVWPRRPLTYGQKDQ